jgi:hypothetical protein
MPGFNQTGPMGKGPMTGRKMGKCTNYGAKLNNQATMANEDANTNFSENFQGQGVGYGHRRRGKGSGMGRRRGW